jgi:uncharacterized membrane protein YgdD (TMEM256/DUF423 family)
MLWLMRLAALSAAIAIGAGAFGAHRFAGKEAEWLRTGGAYQLVHAVAVLTLARMVEPGPRWTLLGGSALFAATLYAMALGAPRSLGAVTPIGGALMIAGWLWMALTIRS